MQGVDAFIEKNFKSTNTTFEQCVQSIVYAYYLLSKEKTYSRKKILAETIVIRGKDSTAVELEDYLRNDLVTNFIEPNLNLFNLENYLFIPGADEINNNVRTGILDIKVCSPRFTGSVYYVFECKRLNKLLIRDYLNEGVNRFITSKYYPTSNAPIAGMISFLESTKNDNRIEIERAFDVLNTALNNNKKMKLISRLDFHRLISKNFEYLNEYKYVFHSSHGRLNKLGNITLYHIVLDYNAIILD